MTKQEALKKIEELKKFIENEEKKPTPEERFWEILKGCVVEISEKYPRSTFLLKDGKFFFEFEKDILWCSWTYVWSVFEKEFNMSYNDIQNLIKIQAEEHFKCKGITPKGVLSLREDWWKSILNNKPNERKRTLRLDQIDPYRGRI